MIKLNTKHVNTKVNDQVIIKSYQSKVNKIMDNVKNKKAEGCNMLGWMHYTLNYDEQELTKMVETAKSWQKRNIKNVVVIGIGGSYIGLKAAIDMIKLPFSKSNFNLIYIANMNSDYILSALKKLENDLFAIVIISKSGTTLEPAIAFNLFRNKLEANFSKDTAKDLIVAITDKKVGTLHQFAIKNKYTMFNIPDNIGGRYSTLTPVGMFVMILMGFDYNQVINGANAAIDDLSKNDLKLNSAFLYACYRHYFYTKENIQIENFVVYNPNLMGVAEQWKQLFGESEGKNHLAMFPTTSLFTTDLHAIGQFLQDGTRNFIETTLIVEQQKLDMKLNINNNEDQLEFLNKKSLSDINYVAFESTVLAHSNEGHINNLIINIEKCNEYNYGYLFIWLSFAAMMSGYLLNINPFDQPGVEAYKKRMFASLKK